MLRIRNIKPLTSSMQKLMYCYISGQAKFSQLNIISSRTIINCSLQSFSLNLLKRNVVSIQERGYAKSRDKGKKGGKQTTVHLSDEELAEVIDVEKFRSDVNDVFELLKEEFIKNLSIRTSLGSLEAIPVVFDGDTYPLNEIAQIIRKSPSLVVINSIDFPQATSDIKKAIIDSGMNLNPQQDGTTIYVPVPKVTKEHREGLSQNAKKLCDRSKERIRDIQNKYLKKMKLKEGQFSEDILYNAQLKVREVAMGANVELEKLTKSKQNELLKLSAGI